MATATMTATRRTTLKMISAVGALTFAYPKLASATDSDEPLFRRDGMSVPLVKIDADNSATIYNPNPDMGQGTTTGLPMMIAEELDLDWANVTVEQLPLKRHRDNKGAMQHTYVRQASGGSTSIRRGWAALPKLGAQGRDLFMRAAAQKWGVGAGRLKTELGIVLDPVSGKSAPYGDLLQLVSDLEPNPDVQLKKRRDYRLIGSPQKNKAAEAIVTGAPVFGIDQTLDGMVHAVIARCPHFCGTLKSVDDTAARRVSGVLDVVRINQPPKGSPLTWVLVPGVAVIAETFWAAKTARDLLEIEWEAGPFAGYTSAKMESDSMALLDQDEGFEVIDYDGAVRNEGDVENALADASIKHSAKYCVSHIAHALMEPHSAVADVQEDKVYANIACQHPYRVQDLAHQITGIAHESIHVDVARSGGAFGRRYEIDFPAEALWLSKELKRPVKVTWTREDELTQDRYRNANNYRMTGGVDANGRLVALDQRLASGYPSLDADKAPAVEWPYEDLMGWHFTMGLIENHRMAQQFAPSPVPRGPWRAPGSVNSAFAQMSFLDELAHEAGIDPLAFNLSVLGTPRPLGEGAHPMHTGRMAACFQLAAEKAGWAQDLPDGRGRGIAGYFSHSSYVAHVVEVSVRDGHVTVERVTTAADCGLAINPLGVRAQIEGSIHDGLSVALGQEITVVNAAVQETNFDSYEMARIDRAPKAIDIHLIEGAGTPTGMGEPAMPPFAPALMNAIFAATGKRIRRLPIADQLNT